MMTPDRRDALALLLVLPLAACGGRGPREEAAPRGPADINRRIAHWSRVYDVPEAIIHQTVRRESGYNPAARNGPYMGLMQIHPQTARTMGFRGDPGALLDPDTNLKYGVKYLRGAHLVARGNVERTHMWYRRGYYYEAKRMGLLEETGLRS